MARKQSQRQLLHAGSFVSLEAALWRELRAVREAEPLAPVVVLVPTNLLCRHLTVAAAAQGGQINVHFLTLIGLARRLGEPVLEASGRAPLPPFGGEVVAHRLCRALGGGLGVPRPSSDLGVEASHGDDREGTLKQELERGTPGESQSYFAALAERPGFHRALLSTIDDLKEAGQTSADLERAVSGILPRAFVNSPREVRSSRDAGLVAKLRDLQALWSAYEARLAELRLYDGADLMVTAARAAASIHNSPWLSAAAALFVYGFYDLNELQRRLVEACAAGRAACVFFPCVPGAAAFRYAMPTFEWLGARGFVPRPEPEPPLPPELDAVQRRLFEPCSLLPRASAPAGGHEKGAASSGDLPRDSEPAGGGAIHNRLRLVSVPDEVREVRAIIRSALVEARAGTPLTRVGVLLRQTSTYAPLFAEECEAGGLAAYHHDPPSLSVSRSGRGLLLLLRLLDSDLARADVMDFLTYADVPFEAILLAGAALRGRPGQPQGAAPTVADWDLLSIEAGIVRGRENWRRRLSSLRRRLVEQAEEEPEIAERIPQLDALTAFMDVFASALEGVPREGIWSELVGAVLDVFRRFVRESEERERVAEAAAALGSLDATGERADLAGLARFAREALEGARLRRARFGSNGPVIVDLMEGRGLPFDVVCVPGLVEKGFPAPPREDPLLSDRERARLARAGLSLPLKGERAEEERLLFRLAVGAGARRVILTYPRLEMSSARERVPSYFLLRVAEAATGRRCDYKHLEDFPGYERVSSPAFAPKRPEEAWRSAEYDLAATLEAVALGDASPLGYLGRLSPTFGSALRAEERRWGERRFTEYDGVLRSKAALAALAERLGPMPWHLSPTELELYASCPFRYFVARVLRVREIEEPEAILRLSGMDRGSLVHDILYRALTAAKREGRLPLKIEDEDRVLAEARESFARFEQEGATGIEPLWALERGSLELDLRRFVLDEATHTEGYVPAFFEVHFGKTAHGKPSELGSDEGVLFELGPQGSLRIVGRIDRIDLCAARKQARVIDYKTGAKPQGIKPDAFAGGTALQLPLYLQAAGALLGDRAVVAEATYRFLTARGGYESVAFHRAAYEGRQEELLAILRTIAEGIAQGRFFPGGDGAPCRGCDYRAVCGAGTAALVQRKADDAVARPYRTMREIP